MTFDTNVFVNCPFDDDYLPLLRPLLFCLVSLQFSPRIALEDLDSGGARIQKIIRLIEESKYGVHDISRLQAQTAGEYYRLNMPFELGLDLGCRLFKGGKYEGKKCLILESEKYRYQAALSDLSNSDILAHNNEPIEILTHVRNWLTNVSGRAAPGAKAIWGHFNDFMSENYDALKAKGFSDDNIEKLPISELIGYMKEWVSNH